jgi:LmbE family N-acetylglucosaminyl deacetylase
MTIERVKEIRRAESTRAAEILGAEVRFFDAGDYPLKASDETIHEMVSEFRVHQPAFVLTHAPLDPHNYDHPEASNITMRACVYAQALGYPASGKAIGAPPVFDLKRKAMESMQAQEHLCCSAEGPPWEVAGGSTIRKLRFRARRKRRPPRRSRFNTEAYITEPGSVTIKPCQWWNPDLRRDARPCSA